MRHRNLLRRLSALPALLMLALVRVPQALAQGGVKIEQPIGGLEENVTFLPYIDALFRFGIILTILASAISIALGAHAYFIASGNAAMAARGKEYIQRALIGLILALIAWVLLTTIHPQFAEQLTVPAPP